MASTIRRPARNTRMLARKVGPLVWSLFPMAVSSPHARRMAPRFCMDLPPSGSLSLSVASERVLIARRPSERGADHNEHRHRHAIRTVRKAVKLRVGQSLHECGGVEEGRSGATSATARSDTAFCPRSFRTASSAMEATVRSGLTGEPGGGPGAGGLDPDAVYAQPLRRGDLPLQVVGPRTRSRRGWTRGRPSLSGIPRTRACRSRVRPRSGYGRSMVQDGSARSLPSGSRSRRW